jgi:MFS family permease
MKYRWELLLWLWLAFFFHQADRQVFNVILPVLGQELSLSSVQLGLVGSVFIATNALMVPVAGFLGDVHSRKRIIVISLFAWSLATLCTGFGAGLYYFIAVRGVAMAAGEAFYFPSAVAMLSAEHIRTRARALSLFQTSVYVGLVASGWIGGTIAARWGWRAVFWTFGACGLVLCLPLWMRLQDKRAEGALERVAIGPTLRAILSTPTARFAALACSAMVFVNVGYLAWAPSYLYERFHLTLAQAGLRSMLLHHLFAFFGVVLGGAISDRFAPARPQVRLELQAFALLAGAPFLYLLGRASTEMAAYGALAGFGFFRGLYDSNTYPAFYAVIAPRFHSAASGLLIAFAFLVASAAPVLLGKAKETIGLGPGLSDLSFVYGLGAVLAFWGARRHFLTDFQIHRAGFSFAPSR